jgi:YgiT-type zinc finger domain-containing protein
MSTRGEWEAKRHICRTCQHEMELTRGTLTFELDDFTIEVENVPMKVCPYCGERYVAGAIGEVVGDLVAETVESIRRTQAHQHTERPSADSIAIRFRDQSPYSLARSA